jgi:hypothetical protein
MKIARSTMLVFLPLLAVTALRAGSESAEAERLVRQLGSDDYTQREAAAKNLLWMGQAARPALEKAQQSADAEVRRWAHEVIRRMPPLPSPVELVRKMGGNYILLDINSPQRSLIHVDLSNKPVTDADLIALRECEYLERLALPGTSITVAGLEHRAMIESCG